MVCNSRGLYRMLCFSRLGLSIMPYAYLSSDLKRFRLPFWWSWLGYIPVPRVIRRWYYRKSFQWWKHPSNHHWKGWEIPTYRSSGREGNNRYLSTKCCRDLRPGERCIFCGTYILLSQGTKNQCLE
jgi:hypothetical protein